MYEKRVLLTLFTYAGLLNILDGWLSYKGLQLGLMEEANPLMDQLYQEYPHSIWELKLVLGLLAIIVGMLLKPKRNVGVLKILSAVCCTLYTGVMCLHVVWIFGT
jgi:hypothetical protein